MLQAGHLGESHVDISTGQVPVTNSESFAWWASQGKLIANYKKTYKTCTGRTKLGVACPMSKLEFKLPIF